MSILIFFFTLYSYIKCNPRSSAGTINYSFEDIKVEHTIKSSKYELFSSFFLMMTLNEHT